MTKSIMTFDSPAFQKSVQNIQARADASRVANLNTANQRASTTTGMDNFNRTQQTATNTANNALSSNPLVQRSVFEDSRNFAEDTRRFNEGLAFKNTADQRANDTDRFRSSTQLEGVKYNADAGVKSTQIGADAQRYGADRQLDGVRLQADASRYGADKSAQASMYGADKGYQASIYNADRGVDQARIGADAQIRASEIGADASRFNALLGTGAAFFNSSQYRPTFNR